MWSNLINCIESDADIKYKLSFLNTLINVHGIKLEIENEIKQVKTKIKEFCADATKRIEGLLLLYAVVHCNSRLYIDNWSQIVLGSLKIPDSLISREIPLKVLNRMLINFSRNSEYKNVFNEVIPEILQILLNPVDDKTYKLSCQSLSFCMKYVPKIAGTRVADIEKLLVKELDNPYGEIVEAIGDCFAALPMCISHLQHNGPVRYKEIWCNVFMKLLNTLHLVINILLKLTEDQEEYVDVSSLPVYDIHSLELADDIPLSPSDIFKSLCQCMAKMMSSEICFVRLPVTELLDTLYRIFKIKKIIKDKNQDPRIDYLKLGFSQILNGAYVILEALILNFSIIEQSHNFVVLMNMSLDAMKEISCSQSSESQVRGSTWKLIDVWLKQYGPKGSCDLSKDKTILHEILTDIGIRKESKSSKVIKNSPAEEYKTNKIFACTHALKVLKNLLETSSCFMEKNNLDEICSTILGVSKVVIQHISPIKLFPVPYCDEKCRKMLYDVLLCCAVYSDPLHSRCIMEAQSIFNIASRDTSTKVRRVCHRFRKLSRYYLNPRKPPPDAMQYVHPSMLEGIRQPVIESVRAEWRNGIEWNNANGPSSDDQMDDSEVTRVRGKNVYSDKMESKNDLMTLQQIEENENCINHNYRRITKQTSQSMGEEDSIDDSDIEPTYVSTDSNPQRIGMNDSSHINTFGMQSCVEEYADESKTERHHEEVVPNLTNNVENNIEEHVSAFVEVNSAAQKLPQVPMENGTWKKKENSIETDEEDSDMEEDGDEEGEVNEEVSDNGVDETSDGKHSPEFDEERPAKRQKCMDEEGDDDVDEDVEDDDIPLNNQSSDEENEIDDLPVVEQNLGSNSENLNDEESQDDIEDISCRSPTIREMCGDFVLAEPTAPEIS